MGMRPPCMCPRVTGSCARVLGRSGCFDDYFHGEGQEYAFTREAAVAAAEEKRGKKVRSLLKQISKLQDLKF